MHFPSLWLTILAAIAPSIVGFIVGFASAYRNAREGGQNRLLQFSRLMSSDTNNMLQMALAPPLLLYALIGEFPVVYIGVAAALYVITGIFGFFITRAAGLDRETRLLHPTILGFVFSRRWVATFGQGLLAVLFLAPLAIVVWAFLVARGSDLSSDTARFQVALIVFAGQAFVTFVISVTLYLVHLWSANTSRQGRVVMFSQSMRVFVAGAWLIVFPFYEYRMDLVSNHGEWVAAAVFAVVVAYLLTVVLPFQIGRTRFDQRRREALTHLTDACDRVLVATDEKVSDGFRTYTMDAVDRDLKELFLQHVRGCDFFRYFAAMPYVQAQAAAGEGKELAVLPTGATGEFDMLPTGSGAGSEAYRQFLIEEVVQVGGQVTPVPQWEWIASDHKRLLPKLDYRLFLLNRIEDFLENRSDEGWLRGLAMQTKADAEKWLTRREGRSVLLASAGVVLSMLVPLAKDEFSAEARAAMRQLGRDAGIVAPSVEPAPAPKAPSP